VVSFERGKHADTLWHAAHHHSNPESELNVAIGEDKRDAPDGFRVIFHPLTGRSHQLRVHAASLHGLNTPIVGDRLYGKASQRMCLHADKLGFYHPVTGQFVLVECPAPF